MTAGGGESKLAGTEVEAMAQRLMGLMEREIEGATPARDDAGPDSIARLSLDSLALIGYLVAVEDEFGIEWDPDVDVGVMRSFEAMAQYLLAKGAGGP
jgi:acyl carrier protein